MTTEIRAETEADASPVEAVHGKPTKMPRHKTGGPRQPFRALDCVGLRETHD
jgi:hypothetical protein